MTGHTLSNFCFRNYWYWNYCVVGRGGRLKKGVFSVKTRDGFAASATLWSLFWKVFCWNRVVVESRLHPSLVFLSSFMVFNYFEMLLHNNNNKNKSNSLEEAKLITSIMYNNKCILTHFNSHCGETTYRYIAYIIGKQNVTPKLYSYYVKNNFTLLGVT